MGDIMNPLNCKNCGGAPNKSLKSNRQGKVYEVALGCCSGAAWGAPSRYWTVLNSWNSMQMKKSVLKVAEG